MVIHQYQGQSVVAELWGLLIIGSYIGYGWALARLLKIPVGLSPLSEVGLYAGWGVSVWIAIGGLLLVTSSVSSVGMLALVLVGTLFFLYGLIKHPFKGGVFRLNSTLRIVWLCLIASSIAIYASHCTNFLYNPNDDMLIYNVLPQQMLDTGTMLDSFSWRRMAAYGGHSFMQAGLICVLPPEYLNIFDRGICGFLTFVVLSNFIWSQKLQGHSGAILLLIIALIIPSPAVNNSSHNSSLFLILVIFATWDKLYKSNLNPVSFGLIGGLVSSAYLSLKAPNLIGLILFMALMYLSELLSRKGWLRIVPSKEILWSGLFSLCFLCPWAAVLYQSNNTILFPLFLGNQPPSNALAFLEKPPLDRIEWMISHVYVQEPTLIALIAIAAASVLPLLVKGDTRKVGLLLSLNGAAVLQVVISGYQLAFKASDDDHVIYRYQYGILIGAAFVSFVKLFQVFRDWEVQTARSGQSDGKDELIDYCSIGRFGVVLLILAIIGTNFDSTVLDFFKVPRNGLLVYFPGPWRPKFQEYRAIQQSIPPKEAMLVFANFPFLFDMKRNPVIMGDLPGQCSPPPFMPFHKGPDAFEEYLDRLKIKYIVHSDFNTPGVFLHPGPGVYVVGGKYEEYSRQFWIDFGIMGPDNWKALAPFFIDMMNNVESFEKDRKVIRSSELRLICLKEKANR